MSTTHTFCCLSFLGTSLHFHGALATLEPQIYSGVEQFKAEIISLVSGRLVVFTKRIDGNYVPSFSVGQVESSSGKANLCSFQFDVAICSGTLHVLCVYCSIHLFL